MRKIWLTNDSDYKKEKTKKVENIERVFLNNVPLEFLSLTLFTRDQNGELDVSWGQFKISDSTILTDVPEGQPMWATLTQTFNGGFFSNTSPKYGIELHLHSGKDMEGGNWSHTDPGPPYDVHSGKIQAMA